MHKIPVLLSELEVQLAALQIETYNVTVGTLQEIFMRFADGGDLEHEDSALDKVSTDVFSSSVNVDISSSVNINGTESPA
eukprot:COSAG05_NODE_8930_length_660_cov_1.367201_1_plen_79_part_10